MRRYKVVLKTKQKNVTSQWWRIRNPLVVIFNALVIAFAGILPGSFLKRLLYRMLGMEIGKNVSFGPMVRFGIFFPSKFKLGDNCTIGYDALLLEHEWTAKEGRVGDVVVGKNAMVGARAIVLPGIRIGKNAVIGAGSVVTKDVPDNIFVAGVPARKIK